MVSNVGTHLEANMNFATLRDAGPLFYREKTKQLLNFCIDLEKKKKHLKNNSNTRNRQSQQEQQRPTTNNQLTQNHERAENVNVALVFRVFGLCTSWWWDSLCWNATYSNYKVGPLLAIHEVVTSLIGGITLVTPTKIVEAWIIAALLKKQPFYLSQIPNPAGDLFGMVNSRAPNSKVEVKVTDPRFRGVSGSLGHVLGWVGHHLVVDSKQNCYNFYWDVRCPAGT